MKEEQQTITGEQVEQSLEEKVREIAAASGLIVAYVHDDEVSISSSSLQYWVTSTNVRTNSTQLTIQDYCDNYGKYSEEFNSIAALLTAQPESEQTLEEAVRGILGSNNSSRVTIPNFVSCTPESVVLRFGSGSTETVFDDATVQLNNGPRVEIGKYNVYEEYKSVLFDIAALLSTRSTKPSYSELEQRVEELEKEVSKRNGKVSVLEHQLKASRERAEYLENQNAELFKQNARLIRERDQAESKLQDCPTEKDMEDFEQLYDKEMARKDRMIAALRKDKDYLQEKANLYQFAVEQSIKSVMEASQ